MGVAGRYILTPAIFEEIRSQPKGAGGEIQLTDAIARLMAHEAVYAFQYAGKRYDCGSKRAFWRPPWSWPCSTRKWARISAST